MPRIPITEHMVELSTKHLAFSLPAITKPVMRIGNCKTEFIVIMPRGIQNGGGKL